MAGRKVPEHQRTLATCWASTPSGKPCPCKPDPRGQKKERSAVGFLYIPYCKKHLEVGDECVQKMPHPTLPFVGNILVAKRDLPAGYRFIYWGKRQPTTTKNMSGDDRAIDFVYGDKMQGMIDPGPYPGAVLQFASSPGPNEWPNMVVASESFGAMMAPVVGIMYHLVTPVPKGTQVCHQYGAGWFSEREITPINVGTAKYPLPARLSTTGVTFNDSGTFTASIVKDGKKRSLGTFPTEEQAMRVYEAAIASQPAQKTPKKQAKSGTSPAKRARMCGA